MDHANILIMTYGTRGDVEPFVALALRLRDRGHMPTLATAEQFMPWITSFGLDGAPLTNALLDLIHSKDGKTALAGDTGLMSRMAAGIRLARKSAPINAQLCVDAWAVAQEMKPDLILYHPKVIAAPHIAEAQGIPAVLGILQPMIVSTSAFPAMGMPELPLPGYNRLSYRIVEMSFAAYSKSVNAFRADVLDLPPIRRARDVLMPLGAGDIPRLHAVSPHVISRPDDWPDNARMTGYWELPVNPNYTAPKPLAEFLAAGDLPVYVGFGSMTTRDPEALGRLVVEALRLAGVRGVIGSGWAGIAAETDEAIAIGEVPFSWLFPRMAAVVHHGGAGTAAAGFRAGVPTVICPFFGDQPGWAARSRALGVAAPPVPRKRLTPESLAESIAIALRDPAIKRRAQNLAADLESENGTATAVDQIEKQLAQC